MRNMIRGGLSGLLAGLLLGVIYFIDYGPGNGLHRIAGWFGLDGSAGRQIGFVLLLALGTLFGLIFGVLQRRPLISVGRAIGTGLLLGAAYWVICALIVPSVLGRLTAAQLTLGYFLYPFMLCLVYGLLLGTIYFQWVLYASAAASTGQ